MYVNGDPDLFGTQIIYWQITIEMLQKMNNKKMV